MVFLIIIFVIILITIVSISISVKNAPILHEGVLLTKEEYLKINKK